MSDVNILVMGSHPMFMKPAMVAIFGFLFSSHANAASCNYGEVITVTGILASDSRDANKYWVDAETTSPCSVVYVDIKAVAQNFAQRGVCTKGAMFRATGVYNEGNLYDEPIEVIQANTLECLP